MMQKLANDPAIWLSLTALVGMVITAAAALLALLVAWAKAKTAEYEARNAKGTADTVAQGQGVQQVTLVQHTAQIAALEAVQGTGDRGQGAVITAAPAPVAPPVPVAPPAAPSMTSMTSPTPTSVTTPSGVPVPLSSAPAIDQGTGGIVLPDQAAPAP